MLHFDTDYMRGAHPAVMERLVETNLLQTPGYGADEYTAHARELILKACGLEDGKVLFLAGGTQTNATVIDSVLARQEGVLAVETSHINVHEAGAVEATGHKVLTLPSHQGKMHAEDLQKWLDDFFRDDTYEHMVAPGMVYITHPTEMGTLYTLSELEAISEVCRKAHLALYLDGARLGYGLAAPGADVTLKDIARLCDVFYIGGTKCGLLFGEAAVILNPAIKEDFIPLAKQCGSILAKGRLLGIQFEAMFTNGLYYKVCQQGIDTAMQIKAALQQKGFEFLVDSPTNQQFVIVPREVYEEICKHFTVALWENLPDNKVAVRICTSWSTSQEAVDKFCKFIKEM